MEATQANSTLAIGLLVKRYAKKIIWLRGRVII
jgi:hypothetical protein